MNYLLSCLLFVLVLGDVYAQDGEGKSQYRQVRRRVELDIRPENSWLEGCLAPAFQVAGWNWSKEFIQSYRGLAFVFNMREDGGNVWHRENYMYGDYSIELLEQLGDSFESFYASLEGENPVTLERMAIIRANAWDSVRSAIDKGLPAVVWEPVSREMAYEHPNPMLMRLPSWWSLIVGYDELSETYIVDSPQSGGRFTIRWDAFGDNERSRRFWIMIIKPAVDSFDAVKTHNIAIKRAIDAANGMRPGNHTEATTHGLAAWEMWLEGFRKGNLSTQHINHHASFIKLTRGWAQSYLKKISSHFPEDTRKPLLTAIEHYKGVSDAMGDLIDLNLKPDSTDFEAGERILFRALEYERAALDNLQNVLEKE